MTWTAAARSTLPDQVTAQILRQIRDGVYRPGDRLPAQRELAQVMQVGLFAVREALQRLEALNVIDVRHGHSTIVKPISHQLLLYDPESFLAAAAAESLVQVLEAREAIEMSIAILAAQRATTTDVQAIRHALDQQVAEDHGDYEMHRHLNGQFHRAVAAACHNTLLAKMLGPLLDAREVSHIYSPEQFTRSVAVHDAIYRAVRDHDVEAVQLAMKDHAAFSAELRLAAMPLIAPVHPPTPHPRSAPSPTWRSSAIAERQSDETAGS